MKRVIWILLLSLCLNTFSAHAAPTPKSGAPCTKQGIKKDFKGKTYTCIKSGKKLVWNKGVVEKQGVSSPSSIRAPSPSPGTTNQAKEMFVPWSTKFSTQTMSNWAFESFSNWSKEQSASQKKHQLLIQTLPNGNTPTIIQVLKTMDEISSGIFSQFFKTKSVTVLGFDQQWVVSQIDGTGGHLRNMQGRCDEYYDPIYYVCMNRDSHLGMVVINDCRMPQGSVSGCKLDLLPHEYFHLVQLNLADNIAGAHWNYGEDYAKNSFPHWLVEGSANFVGSAIVSMARNSKYADARSVILEGSGSDMANALVDYEVHNINKSRGGNLNSYNIGHIATEYLVASIGFQKFLDIWKDYAISRNFYVSFEKITGRSITTFYGDFERARESLGIPPVTRKRN
jgi:hypothetical protein